MRRGRWLRLALGLVTALGLAGCATNAATGRRQLNFYSEAEEIRMGREAYEQTLGEIPPIDDAALQAYVAGLGKKLAARSERPGLPWTFTAVDDAAINAFALPGGYIFVTRGLLTHLTSEAELASVVGHEIGHVTAQHGVNQLSKQQVAMGGLIVGSILAPEVAGASDLAQLGLGLLFLKYSRDDENQADALGYRYALADGYEVREMPRVFAMFQKMEQVAQSGRLPNAFSTHPDPGARKGRLNDRIARENPPPGEVAADALFARVDGLAYGADPRQGYFDRGVFYHPQLQFQWTPPAGWKHANESTRVVSADAAGTAQVELRLAEGESAAEAAEKFLAQEGVENPTSSPRPLRGVPAVAAAFTATTGAGAGITGRALFVEHGGKVFALVGLALDSAWRAAGAGIESSLASFARLADRDRLAVEPQRVRVVKLPRAMTFADFLRRYPSEVDPAHLGLMNQIDDPERELAAGTLLKRVEGRKVGDE